MTSPTVTSSQIETTAGIAPAFSSHSSDALPSDIVFVEPLHELASRVNADPHRPAFHFVPPSNWMNDPNGLIQWQGRYHLFYQHNPGGAFHGNIHWGHAVSDDLVHWEHLPVALAPTPDGPDAGGCWSGCAVDDNGTPTLIYTGMRPERFPIQQTCLATSDGDLTQWQKFSGNPILHAPDDLDLTGFRDPCIWRDEEDGAWYQIVGSGIRGQGGTALLYRSQNLTQWEYLHPLTNSFSAADLDETGDMWECPDLIPLRSGESGRFSGKHLLVFSAWPNGQTLAFLGTYRDGHFSPEQRLALDPGGYFYAPLSMADDQGRRLQWGWIREGRSRETQLEAGWSGVMSLPRELFLHRDGTLGVRPVAELRTLRQTHRHFGPCPIDNILSRDLATVQGDCLEIIAEIEPRDAARLDLELRCTPDGAYSRGDECTRVFYDRILDRVGIDRWRSTRHIYGVDRDVRSTDFTTPRRRRYSTKREPLRLHIFLDHSVLEVFINERLYLSSRIYPDCNDSLGLRLHATGGRAALRSLDVWSLKSIWD